MMVTVKSTNLVKANRALLGKININICTLKCYNFDLEGDDIENSAFLIEGEENHHTLPIQSGKKKRSGIRPEKKIIILKGSSYLTPT